jgi:bacillithiol synthase
MENNSTAIGYEQTGCFSKLIIDYLIGEEKLRRFYKYLPVIDSFEDAVKNKSKENINRQALTDVITHQNISAEINVSESTLKNIELLRHEKTFTVTTGHQLGIYTGPLYFIYKIASTINLSLKLKETYPDYEFVPVFWLASEDHDFEEINHINLFGKKLVWDPQQPIGGPVGGLNPFSLSALNEELKTIMGDHPHALKLQEIFEKAYKKQNLSLATRYLVNELFWEKGLVIIDGNDGDLKKGFKSVIESDLFNEHHEKILTETVNELASLNYKVQVNVRSSNFFLFNEGRRERIDKDGNGFILATSGLKISGSEMRNKIDQTPELFSPNVLMRPLFQEMVLPNIAYVGGGGELAYWLELKDVFEFHKVNFPVLMLRNSFLFVDHTFVQKLQKLGFSPEDIFNPINTLINKFIADFGASEISLTEEQQEIDEIFKKIIEKATATDTTLRATAEAEHKKQQAAIKNLEQRLVKAERQKHETTINQIKKLKEKIFPENSLQERSENFIPFYLKHGQNFLNIVLEHADPFQFEFKIITEKA